MRERWNVRMERDGTDLFVSVNGARIAKRGRPDTPQAKTWIPLEPGYQVHDSPDLSEIIVLYDNVRIH